MSALPSSPSPANQLVPLQSVDPTDLKNPDSPLVATRSSASTGAKNSFSEEEQEEEARSGKSDVASGGSVKVEVKAEVVVTTGGVDGEASNGAVNGGSCSSKSNGDNDSSSSSSSSNNDNKDKVNNAGPLKNSTSNAGNSVKTEPTAETKNDAEGKVSKDPKGNYDNEECYEMKMDVEMVNGKKDKEVEIKGDKTEVKVEKAKEGAGEKKEEEKPMEVDEAEKK